MLSPHLVGMRARPARRKAPGAIIARRCRPGTGFYCSFGLDFNLNEGKYLAARRKLPGFSDVTGSPAQRDQISALMGLIRTVSASQSATSLSVRRSATASNLRLPA